MATVLKMNRNTWEPQAGRAIYPAFLFGSLQVYFLMHCPVVNPTYFVSMFHSDIEVLCNQCRNKNEENWVLEWVLSQWMKYNPVHMITVNVICWKPVRIHFCFGKGNLDINGLIFTYSVQLHSTESFSY